MNTLLGIFLLGTFCSAAYAAQPDINLKDFDPNQERLPAKFAGHNMKALIAAIEKLSFKKGEFEKTEDFQTRLEIERTKPVMGDLTLLSTYAVRFQADANISTEYDADRSVLKVVLKPRFLTRQKAEGVLRGEYGFKYSFDVTNDGSFEAENGFGARRLVRTYTNTIYSLKIEDANKLGGAEIFGSISVMPEQAKRLKSNVCIVFIGTLKAPYVDYGREYDKPTASDPRGVTTIEKSLLFRPVQIWAYECSSGNILNKYLDIR